MFCVFLVTSAQLTQEPLTRENVSLLKKIFPSNLEVINARVYPGLPQNGGDDSSTCLTSVMKVRNEFRPVKYRAGCGAQAFPIATRLLLPNGIFCYYAGLSASQGRGLPLPSAS